MEFNEALEIIRHVIDGLSNNEYDGIIVKRLEASNTLDEGRTTNQTHIAISGEQMNMFPYLMAEGYFECEYDNRDEQLKKYFITQIPLYLYKENTDYLGEETSGINYDGNKSVCVNASIVRSRRKAQSDQVQLSLTTIDDKSFIVFRKLLHTGDYLVLLKYKESLEYDCIGVKASDETQGEYHLSELNNKFYKLLTNTKVDIKKLIEINDTEITDKEFTLQQFGEILKDMYDNAEDKMQVASIHIFGIKYGKNILEKNFRAPDIIKESGLNDSYSTELQKALNIYRCLNKNTYGISIFGESDREIGSNSTTAKRKAGAENILLYGVPGAGKSHTINTKYCSDEKYMERVVFHPDYTYSDFVGQILPRVEKTENGDKLKYVFTPGPFTKMLKKAVKDPENYYYLIIEELNRGNSPAIFGGIFQLLDRKDDEEKFSAEKIGESEYGISNYDVANEVYGNEDYSVKIPSNMFILATMNTADQNVFTLDTAFQRRWNMKQIENNFDSANHSKSTIVGTKLSWGAFATVINDIVVDINVDMASSEDKRLGAYFAKKKELEVNRFPEKVLKYLWDDAFKMDKVAIFRDEYKSLEDVITAYESATEDKLATVLRLDIYNKMLAKMQMDKKEDIDK
jgi:hypothetical protein